ncbi:hypothetical protein K501DRAFT_209400 [Backusella circina FSU 941]|nr:hypothetical protein K501DRAFT_209400 [Backusella circina FSU 941]
MDVYSLTRKKRPSHLTVAQPSSTRVTSDNDSALEVSIRKPNRFDEVTESPTRDHWKPDSDSTKCGFPSCQTHFGLFERRHHCRRCGDIFCSVHCSNYFRLDEHAEFHPRGILSRGCDTCAGKYMRWQEDVRKQSIAKSQQDQNKRRQRNAGIMTQQPQIMEGVTELGRDDIVQPSKQQPKGIAINSKSNKKDQSSFNPIPSVPADWQWSTF